MRIFIDADGCPVKSETYKVATRYKLHVFVVANQYLNIPIDPLVEMVVADRGFDAADDHIVEACTAGDIVITADILLAQRCVEKKASVISPKGDEFTEENIGDAVATRQLMQNLRQTGEARGGPAPMDQKARSKFLGTLDRVIQMAKRR